MEKIIAVLVIMLVINLFMLFAVKKAAYRADMTIRKYFLNAVGDIELLGNLESADKENQIKEGQQDNLGGIWLSPEESADLSETLHNKQGTENVPKAGSSDKSVISYKNIDFKKEYKMVKAKMTLDKREIIQEVINREDIITDKNFSRLIVNIKNRFNFNMIYNLSTLNSDYQLQILRETLLNDEQKILDNFLEEECGKESNKEFSCIDFFNYIEQLAYIYDSHYYVLTGWETDNFENLSDNIVMIYDRNICEGLKVMHQNRLHDYSI